MTTVDSAFASGSVRTWPPYFIVVDKGHNEIDEIGRKAWQDDPTGSNQRYTSELLNPHDAQKVTALLEDLATQAPKAGMPNRP